MIIPVNAYQDLGTANGFCPDKIKKTKKKEKKSIDMKTETGKSVEQL